MAKLKTVKHARFFALVTYRTNTDDLVKTICNHSNSIRAYALIKHDKDKTDVHHHIVLRTYNTWTCLSVSKWFFDDTGQNTFCQIVRDRQGIIDYLIHENDTDDEKAHYDKSDIVDGGLNDLLPAECASDDSYEIVQKLLDGVPIRELVKLYGKDFIYHYSSYVAVVEHIRDQES